MSKGLYIKTYGCQMNVYDSDKIVDLLSKHGFSLVSSLEEADMVVLNTCNIREKAAEKVYSELGRIAKVKKKHKSLGRDLTIAVAGCVAQAEGEEVFSRAPFVDVIVGPQSYYQLPELIEQAKRKQGWAINLDFSENAKFDNLPVDSTNRLASAFLSIQEGCDKFCHFCVVPYTRGPEYSRSVSEIYREAVQLAAVGTKEITLLGQNVNAYHGEDIDGKKAGLGRLINSIAKIQGIERIRYTTSHPCDMCDEELFEAHANQPKLMPFIHLPVQSGSNKILKSMNRKHTSEFYMEIIEKFRKYRADIAFSSDFIVGYPGETDQDFKDTLALVMAVNYPQAYSFKYSPRPGTPASVLDNQVSEDIKSERLSILQELLRKQQKLYNQSTVGKVLPVLLEKYGKTDSQVVGKSPYMKSIIIDNNNDNNLLGKIVNVKTTATVGQNSLKGILEY